MEITRIVMSGCAGSGKTSVGTALAEALGYRFLSAGELARQHAAELGMTIQELQNRLAENSDYDRQLDAYLTRWGTENEGYVLDYRLGYHFLPFAYKVYLNVTPEVAARRIAKQSRIHEFANVVEPEVILKDVNHRNAQMRNRFLALYGTDFTDLRRYDLVVETDLLSMNESVNHILKRFNK